MSAICGWSAVICDVLADRLSVAFVTFGVTQPSQTLHLYVAPADGRSHVVMGGVKQPVVT